MRFLRILACAVVAFSPLIYAVGQETKAATPETAPVHHVPKTGKIPVAFVISNDAVTIDFAGPWEVFKDVFIPERGKTMADQALFTLYTVSDSLQPVKTSGGMVIVPNYTFDNAPPPVIVVVPAQSGRSSKMLGWIRKMTVQSEVVMSVCTGANVLGDAGVLKGKVATTHHLFYDEFHSAFPDTLLERDRRFVQSDSVIFTAGGLSAGVDLALHIVDLYAGRAIAESTAAMLEYEGNGWKGDGKRAPEAKPL